MVKRYFFLFLLTLLTLSAFSGKPGNYGKGRTAAKSRSLVEVVRASGKSFILRSTTSSQQPISFMITDSRGIVVMFGDNYRNGSILNLSHFKSGNYTMYFDNDTNSAAAYFTVSK